MFRDRYAIIQPTDDRSDNQTIPSDKVVPTYKIDTQLYEAYRQGLSGTPEKIQVLGTIAANQALLGQVNAVPSIQQHSVVPALQVLPVVPALQVPAVVPALQVPPVGPALQVPAVVPCVVKQEFQGEATTQLEQVDAAPSIQPKSVVPASQVPPVVPASVKQEFPGLIKTPVTLALPRFHKSSDVQTASPPLLEFTVPLKKLSPLRIPGYSNSPVKQPVLQQHFPTGKELFPTASPVKKVVKDLVTKTPSPETGSPEVLEKDAVPRRTPKFDSRGRYTLVFDWPPNWATREGRRENEAVYPLDIHEINLKSFSPVVGQVGEIIRPVQKSGNAKFGTDNYNAEFSMCMSGITVLGYAFGTNAFCTELRNRLLTLKGTYIIISHYKTALKVPSYLPINHEFEIIVRQGSVITPVTVQKDYDEFRARPTNPEKQVFARQFGQGHKTPAAQKETARKAKKKEPNAKTKLLFLDGQQKIFKYTGVPGSGQPSSVEAKAVSPVISSVSEPALSATSEANPYAGWTSSSHIYRGSRSEKVPADVSVPKTGFIAPAQPRAEDLDSSNRSFSTPASSVSLLTTPSTISTMDTSISRRFSPRSSPEEGCYRTPP